MLKSFFITISMLSTITAITLMNNIGEADARTLFKDPDCKTIDDKSAGYCKIDAQFLDDCYSLSTANCNINVDINRGLFNPSGSNELKLDYLLKSGIACSATAGPGGWQKANCLANTFNNYNPGTSSIDITTDNRYDRLDIEAKYDGSQRITNTAGKDRFQATNDMKQQVKVSTTGYGSGVDLEGDGADGVQLKYNQLISGADNSKNNNNARQQFDVAASSGGNIEFLHDEYGFDLKQSIINTAGPAGSGPTTSTTSVPTTPNQLTTLNQAKQTLTAKVFDDADVRYDTYGLSTLSQNIQDVAVTGSGVGTVQNLAGDPASSSATDGMRVNLEARGYGANVDADNTLQTLYQNIAGFRGSGASPTATNTLNEMIFSAIARQGSPYDDAEISVTENEPQKQTVIQNILNSGGNVDLANAATARLSIGTDALHGNVPVFGEVTYEDLSQSIDQGIKDVSGTTTGVGNNNIGTTLLTFLSQDGESKIIVDAFDQYLKQTIDGCLNCGNVGTMEAIFSVNNAGTFTLEDGSFQGLTQYVSQPNVINRNSVTSTLHVNGADASVLYQQQVSNSNGGTQLPSSFSGTISSSGNYNCQMSGVGTFTVASNCS